MATLQQISASDRLSQLVVSAMIAERPIIGMWEFYPHPGNSDNPRKQSAASGGGYRSVNSDWADNEVDPAFANMILAILGDKVETDVAHERRGFDVASVRASDLRQFAREYAKFLVDEHVNGDGQSSSPTEINGLEGLLPMSKAQAIYAVDNSTPLTLQAGTSDSTVSDHQQLKVKLFELIRSIDGGADWIMMSNLLHAFITSVFESNVERTADEFGNEFQTFNGVPMVTADKNRSGNPVIAQDENPGSITADTQSVYAGRYGERSDLAMSTNVGVEVIDRGQDDSQWVYNVELDGQQGLLNDEAVGRLAGIEVAL
jgi:hypothetical protein